MTTKLAAEPPKASRQVVSIPSDLAIEMREVAILVGSPSLSFLTTAGLRHVVRRIKARKLAVVNGELQPVTPCAESEAA